MEMLQNPHVPHVLLTFDKVHNPLRLPREGTSERPKVVRTPCVFYILTSKCASRHSGVHFFDISTSKSGPELVWLLHFDFQMCFAPQRRPLFRHLNFQKWSEREVFLAFSLANVLRASSRHNSVHFFDISTSKSGPNVPCFYLFHLQMCIVPQQRALFRHRNFQKWSEREVFLAFSLANVFLFLVCHACNSMVPPWNL